MFSGPRQRRRRNESKNRRRRYIPRIARDANLCEMRVNGSGASRISIARLRTAVSGKSRVRTARRDRTATVTDVDRRRHGRRRPGSRRVPGPRATGGDPITGSTGQSTPRDIHRSAARADPDPATARAGRTAARLTAAAKRRDRRGPNELQTGRPNRHPRARKCVRHGMADLLWRRQDAPVEPSGPRCESVLRWEQGPPGLTAAIR